MSNRKILIVTYALEDEVDSIVLQHYKDECEKAWLSGLRPINRYFQKRSNIKDREVVFVCTGVGKVNSYRMLKMVLDITKRYCDRNAEVTVLNLGTAASLNEEPGILVNPSRFIERDLVKIGSEYLSKSEYQIGPDSWEGEGRAYSCNSGDTFVTNPEDAHQMRDGFTAVCDMEAFLQAELCSNYKAFSKPIQFVCWKFITDKIGENSIGDWKSMLPEANTQLTAIAMDYINDTYIS